MKNQRIITFKPSKKQFEAWEALTDQETTDLGYGGGGFGGKSYLGCFWLLAMCLAYPGSGWLMGRKELNNLKRTTLLTFFKVCADYKIEAGKDFNLNQQTNIVSFPNGSQIFLFDLSYQPSDPLYTRLGGLELTGAFVDESNEVEGSAINILRTRLGRRKNEEYGLKPKLLETFNPDKGHVYQEYYKPWKDQSLPIYRKFIKALPTDNPHTTIDYLEQLKNSDKTTIERLLKGNFEYDDDPATLINYDALIDLWTNTIEDDGESYLTADIARYGQDKTVLGVWEGLKLKKVYILEKLGTDQIAEQIKILSRDHKIPFSHILIDEDGIGGGVVDQLRGVKGFIGNATPFPNKVTKLPENYQNLKAQCSYEVARIINKHEMAIEAEVTGESQKDFRDKLIEELEQVKTIDGDKDGKKKIRGKEETKELLKRSPDRADMVMMRAWFEVNTVGSGHAVQSGGEVQHRYGSRPTLSSQMGMR